MICNSKKRKGTFPFDVKVRSIIQYEPESRRGLKSEITKRLMKLLAPTAKPQRTTSTRSATIRNLSLTEIQIKTLEKIIWLLPALDGVTSAAEVQRRMVADGFTEGGVKISLAQLEGRGLVEKVEHGGWNEGTWWCRVTPLGVERLHQT
jgi:hypothetical protein